MKGPGFFRASAVIAAKDLRIEWSTLETLSSSLIFSLIVLVIFSFAFGFGAVREFGVEKLVPGVIWIVLAFASVVGMTRSMQLEKQHDTMNAVFLAPIDRGAMFAGKFLANLVKITALEIVVVPLSALFFDFDLLSILGPMLLVVFLHTWGLTALGTLFAAVASRVGRGEALLVTLLFPATSPLFISAVKCTAALLQGKGLGDTSNWMLIALGFDILYIFVALSTFEFVLEE